MAETSTRKTGEYGSLAGWDGYPYHLPDKPLPIGRVTYEEFMDWADEDTHAEWVDGEIIMSSPASTRHQAIKGFLETVLRSYTEAFDLGEVFSAGLQMKLPPSGREPDILFIQKARLNRLQPTFLDGPADFAVEIVSPESQERDRETKFTEYAAGGLPEYWLLDPTQNEALFYQLDAQGQYQLIAPDVEGKYYCLAIPDFWLRPQWLWQDPMPQVEDVLQQVGGDKYRERNTQKMLDQGGEEYTRYLLEELRNRGLLP